MRVITINLWDSWATVKQYARISSALFLEDASGSAWNVYKQNEGGNYYIPLNYVIKPGNPQIVYNWDSGFNETQIRNWINACLPGVEEDVKCEVRNAKLAVSPNPFKQTTVIKVEWAGVSEEEEVSLQVYDLTGKVIKSFTMGEHTGSTTISWDGKDNRGVQVPSGLYFCRLTTGKENLIEKLIVTR